MNILDMLSPDQVAALASLKVSVPDTPDTPVAEGCQAVACSKGCEGFAHHITMDGFRICKCGHSQNVHGKVMARDLPPTTEINGVEVDLRSEALHDTECADCQHPIQVEVKPKGVDLVMLTSKPRIAVCAPCGRARVRGQRGTLVHDARDFKPEPEKKESELDLTKFSNAELAGLAVKAREHMVAEAAAELPAKRAAAKQAEAERVAEDEALKVQAREERKGLVLPDFTVQGKEVPALDLSDVTNMGEVVSAKTRSPYNKALHALGEPLLDKDTTTYEVLSRVHAELHMKRDVEQPKARLVAEIDPDAKAKVVAFAKVTGKSIAEAQAHLATLGLV